MDMKKMIGLTSVAGLASKLAEKADVVDLVQTRLEQRAVARATRRAVLTASLISLFVSIMVVVFALYGGGWWRSMRSGRKQTQVPPVAPSRVDPFASAVAQPSIVE